MAIGDKKSVLQPSSVQSQQYRLQYSNLTPGGNTIPTQTGGLTAPANARPAVSAFVNAPAPVSLQAPPTIPPALPTPPAPTPPPVSAPPSYKSTALYFEGEALHYSASVSDGIAVGDIKFSRSVDSTFLAYIKPTNERPWNKESIFHIYSGSAVSHSLEIYLTGSSLAVEYSHNSEVYTRKVNMPAAGNFGNGYYLIRLVNGGNNRAYIYSALGGWPYGGGDQVNFPAGFNTANATDMKLGYTFSGSMDYVTFINSGKLTSADESGLRAGTIKPTEISNLTRTYTKTPTYVVPSEITGSNAAASVTLGQVIQVVSPTFYLS